MPDYAVATTFTSRDKVTKSFRTMGKGADMFGDKASRAFRRASKSGAGFKSIVSGILTANIIQGTIIKIRELGVESVETAAKAEGIEKAFQAVFSQNAAKEFSFVTTEAKRLGLNLETASSAYMKVAASAKGTILEGKAIKEVFTGVSEAATSLQLSSEQTEGALTALSQIISKGKVQAEELRGQLGERIPGAFQIASRAMGMTTTELDKFMSTGKLTAEKFIPKFAKQLRKEFGQSALDAANSFNAARNRFDNLTFIFKRNIGRVLIPSLFQLMKSFSPIIENINKWMSANNKLISSKISEFVVKFTSKLNLAVNAIKKTDMKPLIKDLKIAISIFSGLMRVLEPFVPLMPVIIGSMIAYNVTWKAWIAFDAAKSFWAMTVAINASSGAMGVLNGLMLANPIGLIIIAIAAVVGLFVMLEKHGEKIGKVFKVAFGFWVKQLDKIIPFVDKLAAIMDRISAFGSGVIAKIASKIIGREITAEGEYVEAPNKTEIESRQGIGFEGKLDITGAPAGSTIESKTTGAPPIKTELLGAN